MQSISGQRIEALPGATRKEAYLRIEALCVLRTHTALSDAEIAKKAGFGSVEAMHHQLKTWGLAGLLPPENQGETPKPRDEKSSPRARNSGPAEEVADASAAADL